MRKFLIPILMAGAAIPTVAHAQDREAAMEARAARAQQRSAERAERQADRQVERAERVERVERRAPDFQVSRPASDEGAARRSDVARDRAFGERGREMRSDRATDVSRDGERARWGDRGRTSEQGTVDSRGRPTLPVAEGSRSTSPQARDDSRRGGFDELRGRVIRDGQRVEGHRRDGHRDTWRRDWRDDHRYDWRRHRDRNRVVFRIGTYYDPYRYSYRRFNIGYNLWPSYYGSRYWINDPWMYRLPPAYGPYRWVRYYDDALLVNIYTGQVVDVIYSFFW